MSSMNCPECGAPIEAGADHCKYCGEKIMIEKGNNTEVQPISDNMNVALGDNGIQVNLGGIDIENDGVDLQWPIKNKTTAALLAIFLGGLGIHKFYLDNIKMGVVYLLFCWTYIPCILGIIEGIMYLLMNEHNFQVKYHVRLK